MISIGSKEMVDCQVGSKKVKEIYKGSTKIWARETLTQLHQLTMTMGVDMSSTNFNWSTKFADAGLTIGDKIKVVIDVVSGDDIVLKPDTIPKGSGCNNIRNIEQNQYVGPFAPGQSYTQYITLQDVESTGGYYNTDYLDFIGIESNYNDPNWPNGKVEYRISESKYRDTLYVEFRYITASNWINDLLSTTITITISKVEQ